MIKAYDNTYVSKIYVGEANSTYSIFSGYYKGELEIFRDFYFREGCRDFFVEGGIFLILILFINNLSFILKAATYFKKK